MKSRPAKKLEGIVEITCHSDRISDGESHELVGREGQSARSTQVTVTVDKIEARSFA